MNLRTLAVLLSAVALPASAKAGVVINEIYYHAPNDLDDLQWIELYNPTEARVDLTGWQIDEGKVFRFPQGASIGANGYLVVALNPALYQKTYKAPALGPLARPLKRGSERLALTDAGGATVDSVRYKDEAPWPASADGYSASLERITPSAPGDLAENWAASALPTDRSRPTGTPGKPNAAFSPVLPPVITGVTAGSDNPDPGQPLTVTAEVRDGETPAEVRLQYRRVTGGKEGAIQEVPMTRGSTGGGYRGEIPAQPSGALIRYRVAAKGGSGATRYSPAENDLRPMHAAYFHGKWETAGVPFGILLGIPKQPKVTQSFFRAKPLVHAPPPPRERRERQRNFRGPEEFLAFMVLQSAKAENTGKLTLKSYTAVGRSWSARWNADKNPTLTLKEMEKGFNKLVGYNEEEERSGGGGGPNFSPGAWLSPPILAALGAKGKQQIPVRQFNARFAALGKTWDANKSGGLDNAELAAGWKKILPPPDFGGRRRPQNAPEELPPPPRGTSTFLYVDPETGKASVYDYVAAGSRDRGEQYRGYQVDFYKDRRFKEMGGVNFVYEGREMSLLAEQMAYDLYHRLGEPAPLSEFMRLWVDGKMVGYHLIIERPNRSFLRRNKIDDGGELYKLIWYGGDIIGQHEKKTHARTGHKDLLQIVDRLNQTQGDAQWEVIEENFDVDEVATYFALNMILSHWDGFFNNYYTYHDTGGTGKWQMYPWDQDQTWGMAGPDEELFYDMPLDFGMNGARPAGSKAKPAKPGDFAMGEDESAPWWWRPPGFFSGPLLANPRFRRIYLDRIREILDRVYTREVYFPLIDGLAERLKEDIRLASQETGQPVEGGLKETDFYAKHLKDHLVKRRQFLLEKLAGAAGPNAAVSQSQAPRP
jgi:hypothetical protein